MKKMFFLALFCLFTLILAGNVSAIRFNDEIALDTIQYWNSVTNTYTVRTDHTNFDIFPDDANVGDWIEFKGTTDNDIIQDLMFTIDTALVADDITLEWEYLKYFGVWAPFVNAPTDGTNNFTQSGTVDWNFLDAVNVCHRTDGKFTVRARITALTNLTEGGHATKGKCGDGIIYIENGDDVTLQDIETANDADGWGDAFGYVPTTEYGYSAFVTMAGIRVEAGGRLSDTRKVLILKNVSGYGGQRYFYIEAGGEVEFGTKDPVYGNGYDGVYILPDFTNHPTTQFQLHNYGTLKMYGGGYDRLNSGDFVIYGTVEFRNAFLRGYRPLWGPTSLTTQDFTLIETSRLTLETGTYDKFHIGRVYDYVGKCRADFNITNSNWTWVRLLYTDRNDRTYNFINGSLHIDRIDLWDYTSGFYRKWTVNIHVQDNAYNDLEGVNVVCKDKDGVEVFNVNTNANGKIPEQQVTEWQVYNADVLWDDRTMKTPHTFTFTKDGYEDYEVKFDVNSIVDMTVVLEESPEVFVKIAGGTEYNQGETARIVAIVTDKEGAFLDSANADCNCAIFNPSNEWNGGGEMTYLANGTFYYDHSLALDAPQGVWIATVDCNTNASDNNTAYDSHAFHVAPWITDLNSSINNITVDNNAIAQAVWDWSGNVNNVILKAIANAVWTFVNDVGRWVHGFI